MKKILILVFVNTIFSSLCAQDKTKPLNSVVYADFGLGLASLANTPDNQSARPLFITKVDRVNNGYLGGMQLGFKDIGSTMLNIAPRFGYSHQISNKGSIYGGGMMGMALIFGNNTELTLNPGLFCGINANLSDKLGFRLEFQNQFGDGKANVFGSNITDIIYSLCFKL